MLHPNVEQHLANTKTANNLFTRIACHALYVTIYSSVRAAAFAMRKEPLDVLMDASDKLDLDLQDPRN